MIELILIAHKPIADSFCEMSQHFFNDIPDCAHIIGVNKEDDIHAMENSILSKVQNLKHVAGVIILVDIFGATPANIAQKVLKESNIPSILLTGLNIPMMVKAFQYAKDRTDLEQFAVDIKNAACSGILTITRQTLESEID